MTTIPNQIRRLEGEGVFLYHRIVGRLTRWQVHGRPNLSLAQATGRPILWAMWHEQISSFVMYADRFIGGKNFCLIRVGDDRGDILERLATRMGADSYAVDMQGSPVVAGRAVLRVIQAMKSGKQTLIAPDGPDGPPFQPKGGVAVLAKKAKAVVIPIGTAAKPLLRIPRWDQYQLPIPFTTMHIHLGKPIIFERNMEDTQLLEQVTTALSEARYQAQALAGLRHWP